MPHITIYVSDTVYKAWLEMPKDQKKAVKGTLKYTLESTLKGG